MSELTKKKMLLNLSNHPSNQWAAEQTREAERLFGEVVDLPFPPVDPAADEQAIQALARNYADKVCAVGTPQAVAVHVMGEMTLTYALVGLLRAKGYRCVASTSERQVLEEQSGRKVVQFTFVRFRDYVC